MPEDESYWRLLAIFCAQNNINVPDVGIPAAQKAVMLAKNDASSLDLLGWLLMVAGRYEESESTLLHALAFDPQHASAHLHLGMLYMEKQDRASAFAHLVNARDLGNSEAQVILDQYFP